MHIIETIMAKLDERYIARYEGNAHEEARLRYRLNSNTVASFYEFKDIISITSYVTSLCMNYRYTGQYRGSRKQRL